MTIVVPLKQVPDTDELRLDPETNTVIREGVGAVLNPLDAFPLEAALRLREACGGSVTALSMGPPQAEHVLRKAIALGSDTGVLLSDRAFAGADTWATSLTLARAIQVLGPFDLVLCGKQAVDGDTAQVGPGLAAHLGLPQVTNVIRIEVDAPGWLRVARLLEHGIEHVRVPLPALLTVLKDANEPRLPTLAGRLRADTAALRVLRAADLGLEPDAVGLAGSPTRVVRIAAPDGGRAHVRLEGRAEDTVRRLLDELDGRPRTGRVLRRPQDAGEGASRAQQPAPASTGRR